MVNYENQEDKPRFQTLLNKVFISKQPEIREKGSEIQQEILQWAIKGMNRSRV